MLASKSWASCDAPHFRKCPLAVTAFQTFAVAWYSAKAASASMRWYARKTVFRAMFTPLGRKRDHIRFRNTAAVVQPGQDGHQALEEVLLDVAYRMPYFSRSAWFLLLAMQRGSLSRRNLSASMAAHMAC